MLQWKLNISWDIKSNLPEKYSIHWTPNMTQNSQFCAKITHLNPMPGHILPTAWIALLPKEESFNLLHFENPVMEQIRTLLNYRSNFVNFLKNLFPELRALIIKSSLYPNPPQNIIHTINQSSTSIFSGTEEQNTYAVDFSLLLSLQQIQILTIIINVNIMNKWGHRVQIYNWKDPQVTNL